jgi:hypothetical protein
MRPVVARFEESYKKIAEQVQLPGWNEERGRWWDDLR